MNQQQIDACEPVLRHWAFCWPWEVFPWSGWFLHGCTTQLDAKNNALYVGSYLKHGHYTRIFGVEHVTWK